MVAAAIVGATVIGGIVTSSAAGDAADAQVQAANSSNATQLAIFNQQRADTAPWRAAGQTALGQLSTGTTAGGEFNKDFTMADFQQDPGYQFRMAEGQKAIERSAAARGNVLGGSTLKALTSYSQGVASDEFQNAYNRFNSDRSNRFNRLASLAGVGQTANQQLGQAGQNYANAVSSNNAAAGNASAAASIAGGKAVNSAIGTGMNTWMQYQMMNRAFPTGTGSTSSMPSSGGLQWDAAYSNIG